MAVSFIPSSFSSAATCAEAGPLSRRATFPVADYDLAATLKSGQAFRWEFASGAWDGVVGKRSVRLRSTPDAIDAEVAEPVADWKWLADYLQIDLELGRVLATFPDDAPMRAAVKSCRGLRLLRQDSWECLASFILSSTKRIVQIQQIVALLCERFGEPISTASESKPAWAFPRPERLAGATESELRACKMGFRAPYLKATAHAVAHGQLDLNELRILPMASARMELMSLPGVGRKIADCVLLFAYGFPTAFPVDVWVMKALQKLYFPKRRAKPGRLRTFSESYFGPNAGYAQQYLFHYVRTKQKDLAQGPHRLPGKDSPS